MLQLGEKWWLWPLLPLLLHSQICTHALECYCSGDQEKDRPCLANNTCHTLPGEAAACYKSITSETYFDEVITRNIYGCFFVKLGEPHDWLAGMSHPLRCRNVGPISSRVFIRCCLEDMCNHNLNVTLAPTTTTPVSMPDKKTNKAGIAESETNITFTILKYTSAIFFPVVFICVVVVVVFIRYRQKHSHLPGGSFDTETDPMLPSSTAAGSSIQEYLDFSNSGSGGGAGLPLMMQITIARQIQLEEVVGMGRFGDVKRGRWRGDNVAVKIFHSREEASWFREAEIYQTCLLRHDNILGFIAADNIDNGTLTQLLLVTEFHERGSLYNYLNDITELDMPAMVTICHTIACGLAHLHMEIFGKQGKPAIAHRDLKSKNILVKRDGLTCCIADMGLAVKHESSTDTVNLPTMNDRVGTNRYMAPEVLSDAINMHHFDSFKQGDVYSLGLVYWEVVRRTSVGEKGKCDEYQVPYFDLVPSDPTIENMRHVVCEKNQRPTITNRWHDTPCLGTMSKLIKECWHEKPAARLTALRIKKTLTSLAESEKVRYVKV